MTGVDWTGRSRQDCPECEGRKTLGMTRFDDGTGKAHCFRCEYVETMRPDERKPFIRPAQAPRRSDERHEVLSDYGRALWDACGPVSGPARAYLEARACCLPPADGDLRWHPEVKHAPSGYVGPALVALLTDAQTREPRTLHRTWIRADGTKAPIDPPRLLLAGHRKAGAVCRLWPDEAVTLALGVAEGIETSLSLAHAGMPVWACIDAGNLAAFPVLPGVEVLTIAVDHDEAGMRAAEACASRWAEADACAAVYVAKPERAKTDLNDLAVAA